MASQAQFRGHGTASWERERSMHDSWWCVSANRLCGCLISPSKRSRTLELPAIGCPGAVLGCGTGIVPRPRYLSHAALSHG